MFNLYKKITYPLIVSRGKTIEENHFSRPPIIIGAAPRSGTTLLLSILDAVSGIHAIHHQTYAFTSWEQRPEDGAHQPKRLDRLYRELILHSIKPGAHRWCEKTPKNIIYFDKILSWYQGGAKLIHLVRDGRDVTTSRHPRHRPDEYWVSVEKWVAHTSFGLKFKHDPNVHTLRYEDLVFNFDAEMARLCAFLDEPDIPEQDSWIEKTSLKRSKHWHNPLQTVHTASIARWKTDACRPRLNEFMKHPRAAALLAELGYEE